MAPGSLFAGYTIVRLLGSGGMGEVYLVEHPRLPRKDALKVLPVHFSGDAEYRERFLREADLAASLWHPNIVRVNDRGEYGGQLWIAMDYVDGTDADQLLADRYPAGMPVDLAAKIVASVADALDYSHRQGLLHRDVKPANIMVTASDAGSDPRILLADFGIARTAEDVSGLTATNMTIGTVAYAAPEQLMGEPLDGRADQYALAATAYQLLTGLQLFPNSNPGVVISRHLNAEPPAVSTHRPELRRLDVVLARALSKHPDDRYPDCRAFAHDLAGTGGTAAASSTPTRPAPTLSKHATHQPKPETFDEQSRSAVSGHRWLVALALGTATVTVGAAVIWAVDKPSGVDKSTATPAQSRTSSSASVSSPGAGATPRPSSPVTTFAVPAPNPNRPAQGNCPPACTQIPDSAWISPSAIPLYSDYNWPALAPLSESVSDARFLADDLCAAGPQATDERGGALAARIMLPNPPGQWQLQVQILHWRGDPWVAGQRASAVMESAASLLRNQCSSNSPAVSVTRIAEQNVPGGNPGQSLTATITRIGASPRVVHEYLISDLRNSTVVELAMFSNSPPAVEWPEINDDQLLADMVKPLCIAYVNSCST